MFSQVTVLAGWWRAGEEAAATPELGHIRKEHLSQCFSPFHPTGASPLTQLPAPTPLFPLVPSCVPVPARLQMLLRPPWALPPTGVERCRLGTQPLSVPVPGSGRLCCGDVSLDPLPLEKGQALPVQEDAGARAPHLLCSLAEPGTQLPSYL